MPKCYQPNLSGSRFGWVWRRKGQAINVDKVWFRAFLKLSQILSNLSHLLLSLLLDQVAVDCAQKQESAFTELGLTPEQDRFIACFSPLQTKARCAAEEIYATTLPHPWIGSEQDSADSHEDRCFRHFLDHSHLSPDQEILACHIAVTVMTATSTNFLAELRTNQSYFSKSPSLSFLWGNSKCNCLLGVGMDVVCFVSDDGFNDISH